MVVAAAEFELFVVLTDPRADGGRRAKIKGVFSTGRNSPVGISVVSTGVNRPAGIMTRWLRISPLPARLK